MLALAFQNATNTSHAIASCGMTRSTRVHNMPHVIETDVAKLCRRCAGTPEAFEPLTKKGIHLMYKYAFHQGRRSPYGGMPLEYVNECRDRMLAMFPNIPEA